jgi:hypothetical protein
LTHNTHHEFVGLDRIKDAQAEQLQFFETWAIDKQWMRFHNSHYDWWMFPINEPSRFAFAWVVYDEDIAELKKDEKYISNYLRGVELLALSWSWNLEKEEFVNIPEPGQGWANWPIRLYKCSKSLQLFGFEKEFNSMRKYANTLIQSGTNMHYNGRDLSLFFQE